MIVVRVLAFAAGLSLVLLTVLSAIQTFVLPRAVASRLNRLVFVAVRRLFNLRLRWARTYRDRDAVMALYAPVALFMLPPVWLTLVAAGYAAMFWAQGGRTWSQAFLLSGSSLLTLGLSPVGTLLEMILAFSEASLGLILVALLIAYLPTIYAAFARREAAVTLLEVRAGSPPSAVEMIRRYHRIHGLERLHDQWVSWEVWFAEIAESHTSLAALVFFRSPHPQHSWVTASGAVLDAAALAVSALDIPHDVQANLCIRAGYLALRAVADFFRFPYDPDPRPGDPISVTRQEFNEACDRMAAQGVPLKSDREQAWRDFVGWRVNYDSVLLALADLTMAPEAPWSSDRALGRGRLGPLRHGR